MFELSQTTYFILSLPPISLKFMFSSPFIFIKGDENMKPVKRETKVLVASASKVDNFFYRDNQT